MKEEILVATLESTQQMAQIVTAPGLLPNTSADISFTTESPKTCPSLKKRCFIKVLFLGTILRSCLKLLMNQSTLDMFSSIIDDPSSVGPASPGMELLIEDQQAATKRLPKNVRFNQSFDVAKVVAEDLSKYNTEAFEEILECFKTFSLYMYAKWFSSKRT